MSLFAGTSFVADPNKPASENTASTPTAIAATSSGHTGVQDGSTTNNATGTSGVTRPIVGAGTEIPVSSSSTANKTGWSAALRFAPAASRKPKAVSKPSTSTNTTTTATTTTIPSGFKPVSINAPSTSSTFFAAPVVLASEPKEPGVPSTLTLVDGKKTFKPPSMTLEGIIPGGGAGSKRGHPGGEADGRGKKRWKKNKKKQFEMPVHIFQPHELYNPAEPNDLQLYKEYRKAKREETRVRRKEEEERKRRGSESEASYYSEDEREEQEVRRDAPRTFAPPTSFYNSQPGEPPAPNYTETAPPPDEVDAARRQAMQYNKNETADEAYARRLALSQPQAQIQPVPQFQVGTGIGVGSGTNRAETADEAYARRVAMSAGGGGGGLGSSAGSGTGYGAGLGAGAGGPPAFVRPASSIPTFVASNNTLVPPTSMPPPSTSSPAPAFVPSAPVPSAVPAEDRAAQIQQRIAAAKAIAEKIAALKGPPAEEEVRAVVKEVEEVKDTTGMSGEDVVAMLAKEVEAKTGSTEAPTGTFAERMMKKWGHQEGQGLGKQGDGIIHALAAENIDASKKKSRSGWVQASSSKGKLINSNQDTRRQEDKEKYGEPSQVVCLSNVLASPDMADEDLQADIGDECGKHGIVERVVMHVVDPPPAEPSDGFRIFVVFSGLAGAWQTVKMLNGRMFGGREVRATYFDKGRFDRGDRSGRLL
ncbi:hypothetical protein HD553DRAFT_203565 [Filobasidium floriforme]|uniref:uncharacterized protein n=1 Tax=Filobasidium floriforme TaxID=5210 RepID=UPI001E8E0163|nr:uncharacterized protein HD553DRAFT_203565 [Filobasidium floriforme]KAH8086839.1 hypothetical protein HD553DRAFT_203565 [Filobasidium floriforme]